MTMRGIKTFPLRMERQCRNACRLASWLAAHPAVAKVNYPADPNHPDAAVVARLFPKDLYGAMVSFELKDAVKQDVFAWMDRLKMIVRGTSLGDVHTMVLYPVMASHRDISPKQRERMGIGENLLRLSVGIEDFDDIAADLSAAFGQ
jgi:cystathionine gamma-synthase/methionine-gamma-lyase